MLDVFVCHSSEDHAFVSWLRKELGKKGITAWVDEGEIHVGDSLICKIDEGISKTRFFVAILSKNSLKSEWVKKELEMAITKEIIEKKIIVLPVVIDDSEIPLYVKAKKYADFKKSEKRGLLDLLDVLVGDSHFQCMLFRQRKAAIKINGYRQKLNIKSYKEVNYKNEKVPIVVRQKFELGKCFFAINILNLTKETKKNIKVEVKPRDSTKRILECSSFTNTSILSGGINSNFVSYNVNLMHPYDEHHFEFALNTDEWPEIEIISESGIWNGEVYPIEVTPGEYEPIPVGHKFVYKE